MALGVSLVYFIYEIPSRIFFILNPCLNSLSLWLCKKLFPTPVHVVSCTLVQFFILQQTLNYFPTYYFQLFCKWMNC